MTAGVPPRLKMVADEHRVETKLLGEHCIVEQYLGRKLLGGSFVTQL